MSVRLIGALLAVVVGLGACAGPFGVVRVDPETVDRELTANALSAGRPSAESRNVLLEHGLLGAFDDRPEAALDALHRSMVASRGDADVLFALAELSFLHGDASGKLSHLLAAVVYAYAYLFPDGLGEGATRFDPRLRLAADIYNRALTTALLTDDGSEVVPRGGTFALPFGELAVDFDPASLRVGERTLYRLIAVAELSVSGLAMRYRRPGLGAPLAASTAYTDPATPHRDFVAPAMRVPVTLLLRIDEARRALVDGRPLTGKLEPFLYAEPETVAIAGERVPLEVESTAALALTLSEIPVLALELRGFLGGLAGRRPGSTLVSTTPYRPGRIPVVFVHGTASSPARWAEMLNRLEADPVIRRNYQFWFFIYDSGNPVPYSALQFRRALREAADRLDPERRDPAVGRAVLIGHSQGGLLAKMQVIDSGDRFWSGISRPLEDLDISEETRSTLREALFVRPLPGIARVIFIATPHRGSFVAGPQFVRNVVRRLVSFPTQLLGLAADMARNREVLGAAAQSGVLIPSAVDNMSPRHRFVRIIQDIPLSPRVKAHSIIAVKGTGPVAEGDDGVVAYASAHIDGVESEKVVRSAHSTQGHPETIEEVRRILRLHIGQP